MASLIMISTADRQRTEQTQRAVDRGELPAMTTITKRPSDFQCWQGVYYGGQWYPPSDPRGAELEKMRYMLPAGDTKEQEAAPLMLGEVEIQTQGYEFFVPHITVLHSASYKRLDVHFTAHGRIGKQKNYYLLYASKSGDQVQLSTGGAKKCTIALTEWQTFIDQVEVRVSPVSKTTVEFTQELAKMARDVKAYRRQAPTDAEWAAETGAEPVKAAESKRLLGYEPDSMAHVVKVFGKCIDAERDGNVSPAGWPRAMDEFLDLGWQFVRTTGGRPYIVRAYASDYDVQKLTSEVSRCHYSVVLANYMPASRTIIHPPLADELFIAEQLNELSEMLCRDTDDEVRKSAAAWNEILSKPASLAPQDSPEPASEAQPPTPVVLPQMLQSKEEALEAIAMSKLPVSPEKVDELLEAIKFSIANRNNAEARILPGGYYFRSQPENAPVPTYVLLCHPDHPNRVVVGELSIMSDKDTHSELEFVSSRGEIRDYMARVAAGMAPSTNAKLPGILVQQPIPDDAKQKPLRSGNNQHAEVAPDELPLFAAANDDPETA